MQKNIFAQDGFPVMEELSQSCRDILLHHAGEEGLARQRIFDHIPQFRSIRGILEEMAVRPMGKGSLFLNITKHPAGNIFQVPTLK